MIIALLTIIGIAIVRHKEFLKGKLMNLWQHLK